MPSPLLHSFAGALLTRSVPETRRKPAEYLAVLAALVFAANAPDLDFLAGIIADEPTRFHRGASHSLLLGLLLGCAGYLVARWANYRSARRLGLLLTAAWLTHLFLDMLSPRGDPYRGVALAWPFLEDRFSFTYRVFIGVRFDPKSTGFLEGLFRGDYLSHNLLVVASEALIVAAVAGLMWLMRKTRPRSPAASWLGSRGQRTRPSPTRNSMKPCREATRSPTSEKSS